MKPEFVDNRNGNTLVAPVGVASIPVPEPEQRAMAARLSAVVAHLYGLTEVHVRHIFETFHDGWDYHGRLDAVLRQFHAWERHKGAQR